MPGARSQRGQIVIPALFIFPTLMLFVYLIFETAKLSREKIRHQFAVDAAAFVEMTNYSDFLNRSAYVNGAFPMRIFFEGFHDTEFTTFGKGPPCPSADAKLDELLYDRGVFPRDKDQADRVEYDESDNVWDIGYGSGRSGMNDENPSVGSPDCAFTGNTVVDLNAPPTVGGSEQNCLTLLSLEQAKCYNINWDDANQVYKLYVQIYQLLGSVESAQYSVLSRLVKEHNFLKKSYWLNTGGDTALAESEELVRSFRNSGSDFSIGSVVKFHCIQNILFHGNQLVSRGIQPYEIWASDPPPALPETLQECTGLFQLVTVKGSVIQTMKEKSTGEYPGWPVEVRWSAAQNYFNVDLNNQMANRDSGPRVRATVSVGGFEGAKPAVWYENGAQGPTPKFQVRLYP